MGTLESTHDAGRKTKLNSPAVPWRHSNRIWWSQFSSLATSEIQRTNFAILVWVSRWSPPGLERRLTVVGTPAVGCVTPWL
jgi:hypothetical protein